MSKILQVAQAGGLRLKKQGGAKSVALCCFHAENSPSMVLDADRDSYHCFACGASGGFVKLAERLSVDLNDALGPLTLRDQVRRAAPPAPAAVAADFSELPTTTADITTRQYLVRRGWLGALELGLLRFPTAAVPAVKWGARRVAAFELGFRLGALLLDYEGRPSGLQLRKVGDCKPETRFYTLGSGAFGARSRIAKAQRIYLVEGLGDYLVAARMYDRPHEPVIGVPGTATARKQLDPCAFPRGVEVNIMFDRDEAGDVAAREVAAVVRRSGGVPMRAWPASEEVADG